MSPGVLFVQKVSCFYEKVHDFWVLPLCYQILFTFHDSVLLQHVFIHAVGVCDFILTIASVVCTYMHICASYCYRYRVQVNSVLILLNEIYSQYAEIYVSFVYSYACCNAQTLWCITKYHPEMPLHLFYPVFHLGISFGYRDNSLLITRQTAQLVCLGCKITQFTGT